MPETRESFALKASFSRSEFERIKIGFIPQQMEDKWFIFLEEEWLYFHRSWTGVCIYALRLVQKGETWRVAETWVNRDPEQYTATDPAYDVALLTYLIDRLLLSQTAPFPLPPHIQADQAALYRHHVAGDERASHDHEKGS